MLSPHVADMHVFRAIIKKLLFQNYITVSAHNVASVYFSDLGLHNQLLCSSWGGPPLLLPAFLSCPLVLCVKKALLGFSPSTLACPLVSSLFSSCLGSHIEETFWVSLWILLGDKLTATPCSSGCYSLPDPPSTVFPEFRVLPELCFIIVSLGTGAPQLCILIGCGFL